MCSWDLLINRKQLLVIFSALGDTGVSNRSSSWLAADPLWVECDRLVPGPGLLHSQRRSCFVGAVTGLDCDVDSLPLVLLASDPITSPSSDGVSALIFHNTRNIVILNSLLFWILSTDCCTSTWSTSGENATVTLWTLGDVRLRETFTHLHPAGRLCWLDMVVHFICQPLWEHLDFLTWQVLQGFSDHLKGQFTKQMIKTWHDGDRFEWRRTFSCGF